jgi:putative endonuclease
VKQFHVYIMASRRNGTLYIGVTSELVARVSQHKAKAVPGFTARYGCDRLVWYEEQGSAEAAIQREKRLKEWRRVWKIALIEKTNPEWRDLFEEIAG